MRNLQSKKNNYTVCVSKTESGLWLIADCDVELAALTVVRYMLKNNLKSIGRINLMTYSENSNHVLYLSN